MQLTEYITKLIITTTAIMKIIIIRRRRTKIIRRRTKVRRRRVSMINNNKNRSLCIYVSIQMFSEKKIANSATRFGRKVSLTLSKSKPVFGLSFLFNCYVFFCLFSLSAAIFYISKSTLFQSFIAVTLILS